MFCPDCASEYREGYTECSECNVALVPALPAPLPHLDDAELVRIFSTSDAAVIPVVESILNGAGIQFMAKSEQVQDFFALGRLFGPNYVVGPVEFFVLRDQAEVASQLLGHLSEPPAEDVESPAELAEDPSEPRADGSGN